MNDADRYLLDEAENERIFREGIAGWNSAVIRNTARSPLNATAAIRPS